MFRWLFVISLAALFVVLHAALYLTPVGEKLEYVLADLWFAERGRVEPPENILVVSLDEDSYQELGIPLNRAWPRARHAELLHSLSKAGVKKVVFDINFQDESEDPAADQDLKDALTLLPTVITANETNFLAQRGGATLMMPELFKDAAGQVALGSFPEDFGKVRRFKTGRTATGAQHMPSLAEAASGLSRNVDRVPDHNDMISYYGPAGTIRTLPYFEALDPDIASEIARNNIVFVGLAYTMGIGSELKDSFDTPFPRVKREDGREASKRTFGVEIHATTAANLMTGKWIDRAELLTEIVAISLYGLFISLFFFMLRPQWAALVLVAATCGWGYFSYTQFVSGQFIPGLTLHALILPLAFLSSTLYFYIVTRRRQRQTQKAFAFYMSPDMAREVARNPEALHLGGTSKLCTALFTDIIEFTNISEQMPADQVSEMLNAYFTEVMDVVFQNDGTLLKFIGDSIFAIWGAPIERDDHAERALRSAVAIRDAVGEFNNSGRFPPLDTRIGVHTGPMVVGNLGSVKRFDYTAIGDSVNLASRIEGLNNYFDTALLFSDATKAELRYPPRSVKIGNVGVKGKQETVGVHTVLPEEVDDKYIKLWGDALSQFAVRGWDEANELFRRIAKEEPFLKGAADYYGKEISVLREAEPPAEWQGELVFGSK